MWVPMFLLGRELLINAWRPHILVDMGASYNAPDVEAVHVFACTMYRCYYSYRFNVTPYSLRPHPTHFCQIQL